MPSIFHSSSLLAGILIWPLRSIPVVAVAAVILNAVDLIGIWRPLLVYAWLEIGFLAYHTWLAHKLQVKGPATRAEEKQVLELFERSLSSGLRLGKNYNSDTWPQLHASDDNVQHFRRQFSAWFFGYTFDRLGREDVLQWLAWSIYDESYDVLDPSQKEVCARCIEKVEKRACHRFSPGKAPGAKSIRLSLDPVRISHRPLVVYVFVWGWNEMWMAILRSKGFKLVRSTDGNVEALVYFPPAYSAQSSARPLLFLHGLGLGFAQYRNLLLVLRQEAEDHQKALLVPCQPSISMAFFHPQHLRPPTRQQFTQGILDLVRRFDWQEQGIDVFSHSMGTIVHGWILKSHPQLCKRSVFTDPVCFVLWEPDVPRAFLYNKPADGIQLLMRYFVASELGIALSLQRYFDWTDNLLFIDDIPNALDETKTMFVLAGQDAIISAPRIRDYLIEEGVKENKAVHIEWDAAHGETLIVAKGSCLDKILAFLSPVKQ